MSNTISGAKGITFQGEKTFIVPTTHDMVETLFNPTVRKSLFEIIILTILISSFSAVFFLSNGAAIQFFIVGYIFWRFMYDFGIGYMLYNQSNYQLLTNLATRYKIFDSNNKSLLSRIMKFEVKGQMGKEYKIDDYPIEFNTWLIFRKVVDLILMDDFVFFIGLFVACAASNDNQFINTEQQPVWLISFRLIVGVVLILFNYWVKNDAHNVIKDYAWYWGDFFFRQINNEELIFDGVFEMVPHPMYSIGYIGYYGFALIAKSYTVLIIACFGHFLQMVFLHFIETPHINKIYGPSIFESDLEKIVKMKDLKFFDNMKPMIGIYNINLNRGSDLMNLIIVATYSILLPLVFYTLNISGISFGSIDLFGNKYIIDATCIFFILTFVFKVIESIVIDVLLFCQSYYKSFTKYYLLNDLPIEKSLINFSFIYNSLISLSYSSLIGLNAYFVMTGVSDLKLFFTDYFYLRLFIGTLLILTQVMINQSIIDSIGYFGWFYGDFFIPKSPSNLSLTKAGVYRYLNNPEQIFGVCSLIGVFLYIPNLENLILCLTWMLNNFIRINFIEQAHMIKLYGEEEVLKDSGVTKTFRKLNPIKKNSDGFKHTRRNSNSLIVNATETIEQIIKEFKKSNKNISNQNIHDISQNLYFDHSDFKLNITNLKENDEDNNSLLKYVNIGENIKVKFSAPADHSPKDWIGLYKVVQTGYNRYKTLISSNGRWYWVPEKESGELVFEGEKLFWDNGVYEFRYHVEGKHDVVYISEPFEIKVRELKVPTSSDEVAVFANQLKYLTDKVLNLELDDLIYHKIESMNSNILVVFERLTKLISLSTNIKINEKVFLDEDLTLIDLSAKLIHMKKVLEDLSFQKYNLEKKME